MRKKFFGTSYTTITRPVIFTILMVVLYSCGSHSVRTIKENKMAEASIQTAHYKSPNDALIKDLFMQFKRVNIEFPDATQPKTISVQRVDTVVARKDGKDITVSYETNIPLTTFQRNVLEQNGKVNANFQIIVPKEFLSSKWSLTLSPKVQLPDSVISLKDIILKGQEFYDKQKADYQVYDDYLASIIDNSQYDSMFVDYKGVQKDLRNRQNIYWQVYNKDWKLQMEYESWKAENEDLKLKLEAEKMAKERNLYQDYSRQILNETMVELAKGNDTTGIYNKYMTQYNKEVAKLPKLFDKREKALEKIPSRFKEIDEAKRTIDDLSNKALSEGDSVQIAKHRYHFDKIAENEIKKAQKEEKFNVLVPFPFRKEAYMDSIINPANDYIIQYKEQIPATADLNKVKIILSGKVNAIDMSNYIIPQADTLIYNITSLSQLADTSLMYTQTEVKRDNVRSVSAYTDFRSNNTVFDIKQGKNKTEIAKVTSLYDTISKETTLVLDSIVIASWTSLDGPADKNLELSKQRGNAIKTYLSKTLPKQTDVNKLVKVLPMGEDIESFAKEIDKRNDLLYKKAIIEMLREAKKPDEYETFMKQNMTADYKIIQDSIYPLLKKIDVTFYAHNPEIEKNYIKVDLDTVYQQGIDLLLDRKYAEAYAILSGYDDYNTAVCLACMGKTDEAKLLLSELPSTADTEFLLAVLSLPAKNEIKTLQHLTKALRLDPSISSRPYLDEDIKALIRKYKL